MTGSEFEKTPQLLGVDSSWSSAPKLSRKVRELAQRSHHAIHSGSDPVADTRASPNDILQDLRELHDEIALLQHKIHARKLDSLIPWVDALKRQVDNRLGDTGKGES